MALGVFVGEEMAIGLCQRKSKRTPYARDFADGVDLYVPSLLLSRRTRARTYASTPGMLAHPACNGINPPYGRQSSLMMRN